MSWPLLLPLLTLLVTVLGSLVTVIWKLSGIATKVDLMLTNHLPHLQADIKEVREEVFKLASTKGR